MSKFTHGSMKSSIFNLTTATIGAGVLSVPRSFYYSGIYLSVLLYLVCALLGYISNILLVKCAERLKKYTYMGLAEKTQNKFMVIFIKINFLIANWGFVVAYVILVNKTFAKTIEIFWPESPNFLRDTDGKFWAPIIMVLIIIINYKSYNNINNNNRL
jgi:amino acid permease